jgi:hypothetical protein
MRADAGMRPAAAIGLAVVSGLVCGALIEPLERLVDSPTWYEVWHGVVPWAVVTVAVGFATRAPVRLAAIAGLVTQLALVAGYYWALYDDFSEVEIAQITAYGAVALLLGGFYGAAGARLRDPVHRRGPLMAALIGAPWLVDATTVIVEVAEPD